MNSSTPTSQTVRVSTLIRCIDGVLRWRTVKGKVCEDGAILLRNGYRIAR